MVVAQSLLPMSSIPMVRRPWEAVMSPAFIPAFRWMSPAFMFVFFAFFSSGTSVDGHSDFLFEALHVALVLGL